MGSSERLEAWLKADKEYPPVLYRPATALITSDDGDLGRPVEKVRRELRRCGRLILEISTKLDLLRR
jgi:hypothetical protein